MVDLETLGTSSNSAILSIGAVEFDKDLGIVDRFYCNIDLQSSISKGFEVEGSVIMFWLNQGVKNKQALDSLNRDQIPVIDALRSFLNWVNGGLKQQPLLRIWGNGADFDNVILQNAYRKFNQTKPWPYYSNRCFRTIKYSFPKIELEKKTTNHNALDDAEHQAQYLIALVKKFKLVNVI